jgi:cystathionine beta-lyase
MAPSKTFNIPGLHFSFAICTNKQLREKLERARKGLLEHPNILANTAANAAYQHGERWLDALLDYLEGNRDFLISTIKEIIPDMICEKPEGTYLAWIDCGALELSPSPFEFFLKNARVALNDGKMFGKTTEQFVRLNFACPRPVLREALEKMAEAVNQLREH